MKRMITMRGSSDIRNKLKKDADMTVFKGLVSTHTGELHQGTKSRAPVKTGELQRSIVKDIDAEGLSGHVTATAEHADAVNYGTRHQSAQPFFTTSYDLQKVKFEQDLKRLF